MSSGTFLKNFVMEKVYKFWTPRGVPRYDHVRDEYLEIAP